MAVSAARGFKQSLPKMKARGMKFVTDLPKHISNADDMIRKGSNTLHTVGEYGALLSNVIGHKGASEKKAQGCQQRNYQGWTERT